MNLTAKLAAVSAILVGAAMCDAASFTFDFQHPDGTGSSFGDAISLTTVGGARDKNGTRIGFTRIATGDDNADGRVSAAELTPGGLVLTMKNDTVNGDSRAEVLVGVPFSTTGANAVRITARYSAVVDLDDPWELSGVGFGTATATNHYADLLAAHLFYSGASQPRFTITQESVTEVWQTTTIVTPYSIELSGDVAADNVAATLYTNGVASITLGPESDTEGIDQIGNGAAYGYLYAAWEDGDEEGVTFTLTSITFSGEDLEVPTTEDISFTFDFEHPDGTGSSFSDAISISTVGAALDKNGTRIGFTKLAQGDDSGDGRVSAAELTGSGLVLTMKDDTLNGDSRTSVLLGVPLPTTGYYPVKITARYSAAADLDDPWETSGVGFGTATATNYYADLLSGYFYYSGTPSPRFQISQESDSDVWQNTTIVTPYSIELSGDVAADNVAATLYTNGVASITLGPVSDTEGIDQIGNGAAYGYLFADWENGDAEGVTFTLTSITFSGQDLSAPTKVPVGTLIAIQ